jgi:DNA-binding transcriptional LysR family regulator
MRFEQLNYLATITRLGSLRRAAAELHVSQPALSETIRNLERELGVTLLDRKRSGASISADGRELLPYITGVLEAVDRLNRAADQQHQSSRMVRVGTVNAATMGLLAPAIQTFHRTHPQTQVEVVPAQQADIHRSILEGSLDLGLINILAGDDVTPGLDTTTLLRGHVVACIHPRSPLAKLDQISPTDLLSEPLIGMRAGYLMHRYVYRLFDNRTPPFAYSMEGAEMGKMMVAQGLGVTLLPNYSIAGDPLEKHGAITTRPIADDRAEVHLLLQGRYSTTVPGAVRDLQHLLVRRARAYQREINQTETAEPH